MLEKFVDKNSIKYKHPHDWKKLLFIPIRFLKTSGLLNVIARCIKELLAILQHDLVEVK